MIETLEFAVTCEVDAAAWAGEDLYERTVTGVGDQVVSAAATESYAGPIAMLGGHGMLSGRSLPEELAAVATGSSDWSVYIEPESDLWRFEYTGGSFTLEVEGADSEAFGYGPAGTTVNSVAIPGGGGSHRAQASFRAKPGVITNAHFTLTPNDDTGFTIPSVPYRAQSVWVLMRSVSGGGSPDLDQVNVSDSLAFRDSIVTDSTDRQSYAGLTDDGRTWMAWPADLPVSQPYWLNELFRAEMGYRGDEEPETLTGPVGDLVVFESRNRNKYAVVTGYPVRRVPVLGHGEDTQAHRLGNRSIVSSTLVRWQTVDLEFWIGGQTHRTDLHRHYRDWLERASKGKRIDAYLRWGDTRRAHGHADASYSGSLDAWTEAPYSTLWTAITNGMGGRLVLRRGVDDDSEQRVDLVKPPMKRARARLACEVAEAGI
jgi:hypothetical protein